MHVTANITMLHLWVVNQTISLSRKVTVTTRCHDAFPVLNTTKSYMHICTYIEQKNGNKLQLK